MTMLMLALAPLVFVISGIALFGALVASRNARIGVERRINLVTPIPLASSAVTVLLLPLSWIARMGTELRHIFTFGIPRRWGMRTNNAALLLIALIAAMAVWLLIHTALGLSYVFAMPLAAGAFVFVPRAWLLRQQTRAEKQFVDLFPDSIDMAVRMLRAGLPITAAIRSIGQEASPPVDIIFAMLNEQIEIGVPLGDALNMIGERIGLADFRFFIVAVSLQNMTGGNLASTLEILTDIMRKRRAVRLKTKAATAEVRLSAYVLGAMPFFVVCVLLVVNPSYLMPLVKDPRGNIIVGVALFNLLIAFVSMRQMVRSVTASGP
jgi:tight adherence protein B